MKKRKKNNWCNNLKRIAAGILVVVLFSGELSRSGSIVWAEETVTDGTGTSGTDVTTTDNNDSSSNVSKEEAQATEQKEVTEDKTESPEGQGEEEQKGNSSIDGSGNKDEKEATGGV